MVTLETLKPDEELGRHVSSRGYIRWLEQGKVHKRLFLQKGRHKLSVDRLHEDHQPHVTQTAIQIQKSRQDGPHRLYGWAVVSQETGSENGRTIELSPTQDNPYHADIVLPPSVLTDKDEMEQHVEELAAKAYWKPVEH